MNKFLAFLVLAGGLLTSSIASAVPDTYAPLVKQISNAVVNISTTLAAKQGDSTNSLGSGFVIDPTGLIVTNNHVIENSDKIKVIFHDGTKLPAKIIGRDTRADIALLKVKPEKPDLEYVTFGSSEKTEVGDRVLAIGNPFGLGGSVSLGIVSSKNRDINSGPYDDYIQTDAAINKGNSGGPLFNMNGQVIGMNTAIISPTGGSIGIGFAIPADTVSNIVDQLLKTGHVARGYFGIKVQALSDDVAEAIGLKTSDGALVSEILPDSPVSKSDIKIGDVITKVDNIPVTETHTLPKVIAPLPIGKTVDVEIYRNGTYKTTKITIAALQDDKNETETYNTDAPNQPELPDEQKLGVNVAGMKLITATPELRGKYGHIGKSDGVMVVNLIVNGPADKKGIGIGDIIITVADKIVKTPEDVVKIITDLKNRSTRLVLLQVEDKGAKLKFVALPIE